MKTGIVRRVDELGRIVIPKEIRRTLRIRDGESLSILVNDESIILKKFSVIKNISDYASNLSSAIYYFVRKPVIITDHDLIISCCGDFKGNILGKPISDMLNNFIKRRESILEKYSKELVITDDYSLNCTYAINTIMVNGEPTGLVIILSDDSIVDINDMKISQIAANFLSKSIEE